MLPPVGGRALDLGCGTGRDSVLLAGRFAHVDAVDLSLPMIEIARARRSRPNVAYRQADLLEATGSGEYDLVLSVMTLHHVPDLRAALAHVKGLLAPGGRIVLADPYPADHAAPGATDPAPPGPAPAATARDGSPAPRREPRPARPGHRLGDLPAVQPAGQWLDHLVSDRFFSREASTTAAPPCSPAASWRALAVPSLG